jgi:hypothetical protein
MKRFGVIEVRCWMNYYDENWERFHKTLKVAVQNDAMLMVMDTLVKMAESLIENDERERAVEILVIATQYPMRVTTKGLAESILRDLEAELCPRVFLDARALADEITLDDLLAAMLGDDPL